MSSSWLRILLVFGAIGLFLGSAPARGQRSQPEWVDMTPSGKLVAKAWEVGGGTMRIRGGLVVRPGAKALFMRPFAKPEGMVVDLFLDVLNESPNTLWVEMQIEVPGQEKGAVKGAEIKTKHGDRQMWTVKDLQWGFQYPAKVSAYSDKKKTNSLGSTTASLVFDEADKATLEEARALAAKALREGGLLYVTVSGWGKPSPEEMAAAKK